MQQAREAIRTLNRAAQERRQRGAKSGRPRDAEQAGENVRATTGKVRALLGSRLIRRSVSWQG